MKEFMLDSDASNVLEGDTKTKKTVERLRNENKIKLITTHIQEDETERVGYYERIPTKGTVLCISRIGMSKFESEEDYTRIQKVAEKTNKKSKPDKKMD